MLLDYQNTSFEVRDAKPEIAVLPIGATERCGEHLPVGATTFVLDALARRVAERLSGTVYLLPTMPLGTSGAHRGTAGTIALEWPTLMRVVHDLVESLLVQGIRQVVVLVGLGGANQNPALPKENDIVKTAVRQLNYDHPELNALWVEPFTLAGRELAQILEAPEQDVHAGELVTSLMLYLDPDAVKGTGTDHVPEVGKAYLDYVPLAKLCPGGVWGRPSLAAADKGRRAFQIAVERTVDYVKESLTRLAALKGMKPGL
jgi:creatinine amidohydrolase